MTVLLIVLSILLLAAVVYLLAGIDRMRRDRRSEREWLRRREQAATLEGGSSHLR